MATQSKVREQLLERLRTALQQETPPWVKGWFCDRPRNPVTDKAYRGVNALWLSMVAQDRGYTDHRWCTFRQAQEQGWSVRKGEKASHVEYWAYYDKQQNKLLDWAQVKALLREDPDYEKNLSLRCKTYAVFNADQIEGMPAPEPRRSVTGDELLLRRDRLLESMGIGFREGGEQAFYTPATDTITMPPENSFFSTYSYMATLLHEAGHATGHESRLDRPLRNSFGSEGYAAEELRAEIAAAMVTQELGIPGSMSDEHIQNHAAYIRSWNEMLHEAPNELFRAINDAQTIADYLIEKGQLLMPVEVTKMENKSESTLPQERIEELAREWDAYDPQNEEQYRDWYESLSVDERTLIDKWDRQYEQGVASIGENILAREAECAQSATQSMTVVLLEPGKEACIAYIPHTLERMQDVVCGDIQAVYPFDDPVAIVCNV